MNENDNTLQQIPAVLSRVSEVLASDGKPGESLTCKECVRMPSVADINEMMEIVRQLIFPEFFSGIEASSTVLSHRLRVSVNHLFVLLQKEISAVMAYTSRGNSITEDLDSKSSLITADIISCLPEVRRLLYTDVSAVCHNDPAVSEQAEVIYCYPSVTAMLHYRFSHLLYQRDVPMLPRIISELAHSSTGIDIHPGAVIGDHFAIDHGTGVVIGATCVIGNHVTLYQGVTLGAKNFTYDEQGHPLNLPRHPIIEDNVTIYSNASVLGRITIGHDSVIGGNVWVTDSLPPYSRVVQGSNRRESFTDGAGI